jgi:tRNA(Ile)-lysidine synthase TilS/MesJ
VSYGRCRCPGYDDVHHEHDGTSGTCFELGFAPNGLCQHCDDARYAAIGRAAERLHALLTGTNDD